MIPADEGPPPPKTMLAKFSDLELTPPGTDEGGLDPMTIVALVFERPVAMDKALVLDKPVPADKPLDLDLLPHGLGVMNKVTPELLLAVIANVIATSPNARVAVARIRQEVAGWKFQTSDGTIG